MPLFNNPNQCYKEGFALVDTSYAITDPAARDSIVFRHCGDKGSVYLVPPNTVPTELLINNPQIFGAPLEAVKAAATEVKEVR